jgi:CO/xanthine dehydrogenase Mo-binding subunit
MDIDFVIDGGAYCTLSPVVLSRGTIHASGPYYAPNVRIRGRAVATNVPPHGAFRGFGAPQSIFALERHMDRVAAAAGLAPEELRRRNFIKPGQTSAVGQVMRDEVDMDAILARALGLSSFHEKRTRFTAANASGHVRRGVGFATFMHGAGFTGSGEEHLASIVTVEATPEGRVFINPTGNPGMATSGSGDVLAGMIGAWLAQLLDAEAACRLAVFLHGLAGDLAESAEGQVSMTAPPLLAVIGDAMNQLTGQPRPSE